MSKEDLNMAKMLMKRCSSSLITIEISTKTIMRYHFIPVRMAIIRKSTNNQWWRRCWEKGTLLHCFWECKLIQPLWRAVWKFLKMINIELPYDPGIPLLFFFFFRNPTTCHIPRENHNFKRHMCSNVHCRTFVIARTWKKSSC